MAPGPEQSLPSPISPRTASSFGRLWLWPLGRGRRCGMGKRTQRRPSFVQVPARQRNGPSTGLAVLEPLSAMSLGTASPHVINV